MKLLKFWLLSAFLMITMGMRAQLADFNLEVTKTDETCFGNATLTFEVTDTTPGSSIIYNVYLLPDEEDPYAVLTDNFLEGLVAGTYKVVAIQSLDDESNTQEVEITIDNLIVDFEIEVHGSNETCSTGGTITVEAISGTIAECEIISGPVTRPLQTETEFHNLPSGTYNIRAFDECGTGKVETFILDVEFITPGISAAFYPDTEIISCDSILVSNGVTLESGTISYPLTVEYTIHVPGEDDIITTEFYESGAPDSIAVSTELPLIEGVSYDITITNGCGDTVSSSANSLDPEISAVLSTGNGECGDKFLRLNTSKFFNSYTIEYLNVPEGFNPADYFPNPNGPFSQGSLQFGDEENPVPFGIYEVQITDECGRTTIEQLSVDFEPFIPTVTGRNNGCFSLFGRIRISIAEHELVSATIIGAPADYDVPLPQDVTGSIAENGTLALNNMPLGIYTIRFTDDCGFEYEEEVEVPAFIERDFSALSIASCEGGFGSVEVRSGNGILNTMWIIAAPASFGQPLPYNVSEFIDPATGRLFMTGLPAGDYTFEGTDACDLTKTASVTVEGYMPPLDPFNFEPLCGNFNITVTDTSNGTNEAQYWLQRYDPATDTWGHPDTGVPYTEGTEPTAQNSIAINNNQTLYNLNYEGDFRIIKRHQSFGQGEEITVCLEDLGEFNYTEQLRIDGAYTMACAGSPNDVYLDIAGNPASIMLTHIDGNQVNIDNGTNPVFTNLPTGTYVFRVTDNCGHVAIRTFPVNSLPSLVTAHEPMDMVDCVVQGNTGVSEFDLGEQNAQILNGQASSIYTITYHLTQQDADAGNNPLPELYTSTSNGQTIYVRVVHDEINVCYDTTSFQLFTGEIPEPEIYTTGVICDNGIVQITAQNGFASYLWSTGQTSRTIAVTEPGTYTVTVERAYGNGSCEGTSSINIIPSERPRSIVVETADWTSDMNTITVITQGTGDYEYSLDGETYQDSNVFDGLVPGVYNVYVRDKNGCGNATEEVALLHYPKFFTPNEDGINDRWRIKFSLSEPNLEVAIYDRFGKLIVTFGPNYEGWDGTYNGRKLPSSDYWFVVTREDGREHRGHFSMVR